MGYLFDVVVFEKWEESIKLYLLVIKFFICVVIKVIDVRVNYGL